LSIRCKLSFYSLAKSFKKIKQFEPRLGYCEMSLIESCNSLGVRVPSNATLDDIIAELTKKSEDLKVKLLLGIALQEANRDADAYTVFKETTEAGSVSGMYQQAAYLYDGRGVEKEKGFLS
jgi:hypothetical protein